MASIKRAIAKVAPRYITGDVLENAMREINEITVAKPASFAETRQTIAATFQDRIRSNESALSFSQSSNKNWPFFTMALIFGDAGLDDGSAGVRNLCESLRPQYFIDRSFWETRTIRLGWQSAIFGEFGAGVIAHELGHIISGQARSAKNGNSAFTETRACTVSIHSALNSKGEVTEQYQEEDWADTFAASVLNELKTDWPYARTTLVS